MIERMTRIGSRLIAAPRALLQPAAGASVVRRIFGAMLTVGGFTILVKLVSTLKDATVARQFGVSDAMDAFGIAYILPSAAISIIAGSLNMALIPTFVGVRERKGLAAANQFFSGVVTLSAILLGIVAVLLALIAPVALPLIGAKFGPQKLALTHRLMLLLLPTLLTTGLGALCSGALMAGDRFALAAAVPAVTPLLIFASVLGLSRNCGIYTLAIGLLAGSMVELGLLAWGLSRNGISIVPRWPKLDPATREVFRQCAPLTAGALIFSGSVLVDQAIASRAAPGSVAALNYAAKVAAALTSIGANAVGLAVLPHLSRLVARDDWAGIRRVLWVYGRLLLMISVPVMLVFCAFSEPIVRLLFQRGAFTVQDTHLVAAIQRMYLLQIPFYILGILLVRAITALNANHVLLWVCILNLSVNTILDILFLRWFGVPGIALSTSGVYVISSSGVFLILMRILKSRENPAPNVPDAVPAFAVSEAGL